MVAFVPVGVAQPVDSGARAYVCASEGRVEVDECRKASRAWSCQVLDKAGPVVVEV